MSDIDFRYVPCFFGCGNTVDPLDRVNVFRRITGWDTKGRNGGSDVVLREPLDEYACKFCIDKLKHGVSVNQETLL